MSVSRQPNGKWRCRVDIGRDSYGRRIRKSGTFSTKREAKAAEHLWSELNRKGAIIRDHIRLEVFVNEVYLPTKAKEVRFSTFRHYVIILDAHVLPVLGAVYMDKLTHQMIQSFLDTRKTYKTAKSCRDVLRQVLNLAASYGYMTRNVASDSYIFPKRELFPDEHNGTWLTTFQEHAEFLDKIDDPLFRTMCELGLGLGLRKGEIFGLNWEDIDFKSRMVHIVRTYVQAPGGYTLEEPKTKKSNRYIPIKKSLAEYLEELHKSRTRKKGAVLITKRGKRPSPAKVAGRWKAYLKEKELPHVSILNMRHSFATACMVAGIDVTVVSRLLGHASITTTVERYIRYKPENLAAEFDRLIDRSMSDE